MRAQQSSREQFEAEAIPHLEIVYARAMTLSRNPDTAADLVQETYLRAFRSFSSFATGTNCKAWLLTILYSIFVNRYHQARREPASEDPATIDQRYAAMLDDETPPDAPPSKAVWSWASGEVGRALNALPEAFRTVLLIVEVDGLSYEETASLLQCPVGTVRSRLSRARKLLFVELEEYARDRRLLDSEEEQR